LTTLFAFLFLFSIIALFVGLVRPGAVIKWGVKRTRPKVLLYYGLAALTFLILVGATAPEPTPEERAQMEAEELAEEEEKAKREQERNAEAEAKEIAQAEAEAEEQAKEEAEEKAKAEEAARLESEAKAQAEAEAQAKAEEEARMIAEREANTPHLGESALVGAMGVGISPSVTVAPAVGEDFFSLEANGQFWIIGVAVKNEDSEARMVDTSMFSLIGPDGIEYEPDTEADIYVNSGGKSFFLEEINPGITAQSFIVFDMPPELEGQMDQFKLRVQSGVGFAGGEEVDFMLKTRG